MKPGKNDCIVWDGTTILLALDIVMNQVTPVTREAPIIFGHVKIQSYTDIYNTCVSHPNDVILLGMADIKDDPYPVLLNVTDNASAQSWTTGACKKSKVGRMLARFFCSLMINSPFAINSKWISTDKNKIADDISCIKKESADEDSPPFFNYLTLTQRYPELIHCSSFTIQPELISLIWEIVLTKRSCHNEIRRLRLKPLGKLITSSGD
jgi:hypothetical protein